MEVLAERTCGKEKRDYSKNDSVALVFRRNVFLFGLYVLAVIILVSCLIDLPPMTIFARLRWMSVRGFLFLTGLYYLSLV